MHRNVSRVWQFREDADLSRVFPHAQGGPDLRTRLLLGEYIVEIAREKKSPRSFSVSFESSKCDQTTKICNAGRGARCLHGVSRERVTRTWNKNTCCCNRAFRRGRGRAFRCLTEITSAINVMINVETSSSIVLYEIDVNFHLRYHAEWSNRRAWPLPEFARRARDLENHVTRIVSSTRASNIDAPGDFIVVSYNCFSRSNSTCRRRGTATNYRH